MTNMDLSYLRPWLDEHEKFASAIGSADPRFAVAREMLEIITMARNSLRPSADSTANYVPNKDIVERLVTLRQKAETIPNANGH
jgi:hypothetical protein